MVADTKVWRGTLHGVPIVEITIGHYLRDWEIADRWAKVQRELEKVQEENMRITETKREGDLFRSYRIEVNDIAKGMI